MWVDYIGSGPTDLKYKVTVVFYRICIGNNLALSDKEYGVHVESLGEALRTNPSATSPWTQALVMENDGVEDTLDNLCPDFSKVNSCRVLANTSYSGYTRRVYVDTVVLPSRQRDYKFIWSSCCRLLSYANINYGAGPAFYMEAGLNNQLRYNNNTPRYLGIPFTFCCVNQPATLSNLPNDPDGDSLNTIKIDPEQSWTFPAPATTKIVYNPGFSSALPTGNNMYYNVAPISGRANFMAGVQGKYALAYRTFDLTPQGDTLSYVSRDLTITVLPCTNLPPTVDSVPQSLTGVKRVDTANGEIVLNACPQAPISFIINTRSNNPNGQIYIYPASVLPAGMTIVPTVTGGTGYATINWTPNASQLGRHTISILAVDSTCAVGQEITLRREFTFTVIVRPGLDAGPDLLSCPLGERPVTLSTNAPGTTGFTWTDINGGPPEFLSCDNCAKPLAGPTRDYSYVVTTTNTDYACKPSDTVTVFIDTTVQVVAPQDVLVVCRPSFVQLQALTKGPGPRANLPCGINDPITCNPVDEDTATVGIGNSPAFNPVNTPFYSERTYNKYQYIIPKRQLLDAGFYSGTIKSIAFLHVNPTVLGTESLTGLTISLACVDQESYPSTATNASFLGGLTTVANVASYTLTANDWNTIQFTTPYSWDTTKNILVDICMGPMTTPNPAGADPVAMTPGSAIQKYDNNINVCGGNAPTVFSYPQRPVTRFTFCPSPDLPFSFRWMPGDFLADSNVQNPMAYVSKDYNYAVYTVGRNGCLVRDSLHIEVPVHNLSNGPQDTFICRNQPAYLRASGGDGYNWYEYSNGVFSDASGSLSCTDCPDPVAIPQQTTTYAVIFTNDVNRGNPDNPGSELGCPDTMFLTVNVWPLPNVYIPNNDTTITFGQSVQLFARGASQYHWTPIGSLSNPNSPAPLVSPGETTNYVVTGTDSNGCSSRDTVTVSIDYRVNQLVPTGFTPNNDGLNDVFKIVNPSFYRLMEFRVFNRWGQEIFSTTDINRGWDGKWKGVDQAMGSYNYLIRVGTPEGNVYKYQGDVTLIR